MKEFLLMLIFYKSITITPDPVTVPVDEWVLKLEEPISAIAPGASFQIDVSSMIGREDEFDIAQVRSDIKKVFPAKEITVTLINPRESIDLVYDGATMISSKYIYLTFGGSIPVDTEWNKISVNSNIELRDVTMIWKNSKK